jgi:hypothetical protein
LEDVMPHDLSAPLAGVVGLGATDSTIWGMLRRFERAALPILADAWELERADEQALWPLMHSYMRRPEDAAADAQRRAEVQRRLQRALGPDVGPCAAAFALHPQLWMPAYGQYRHTREMRRTVTGHLLLAAAQQLLGAVPFPGRAAALARRIVDLVLIAGGGEELGLGTCVGLLLDLEPVAAAPLLDALTAGENERAWEAALALSGCALPPVAPELAQPQAEAPAIRLGRLWRGEGVQLAAPLLRRLNQLGRLELDRFLRLLAVLPDSLGWLDQALHGGNHYWYHRPEPIEEPLRSELARLVDAAVWPLVSDLRPETWPALRQLSTLRGGRFLLRLLEEVDRLGLPRLNPRAESGQGVAALLHHLLSVTARRPDEDDAALTPLLRQVGPPALLAALPHASAFTAPICAALGWEAALPLIASLRRLEAQNPAGSVDPADGVIPAAGQTSTKAASRAVRCSTGSGAASA